MARERYQVLLIVDKADEARLIQEMLQEAGPAPFDLQQAGSLAQGVTRLAQGGIDVVLLDLGLSHHNGRDGLAIVREVAPVVPVIALTGRHDAQLGVWAVADGAQEILRKGEMTGALLIRHLYNVLEGTRASEMINRLARFPAENPNPVLSLSADFRIRYANPASEPLLAAWGRRQGQHLPGEWQVLAQVAMDTGGSQEVDMTCGERVFSLVFTPIGDADHINIYGLDITERIKSEEALKETAAETEWLLQSMSNAFVLFESVFDAQGHFVSYRFLYINKAYEEITGVKSEEVLGKTVHQVWPGTEPEWIERYGQVAVTGKSQTFDLYHDPTKKTYHCTVYRPYDTPDRFCVVFEDITEQIRIREELRRSHEDLEALVETRTAELNQRVAEAERLNRAMTNLMEDLRATNRRLEATAAKLQAANQELEDFAYVVSHDLKAPLRGIIQLTNWLSSDYRDVLDAEGQEMLELLDTRANRMHSLIDGILQYSRIGRIRERERTVDLGPLVEETIALLSPPPELEITIEGELPTVLGERTRLQQVFQNLIGNAIKYMDKADGWIKVRYQDCDEQWRFSIADNGPGIAPRYQEKIFGLFQTLAPQEDADSTGVGLALVKKIVENWGGDIDVESTPGQGSTFTFTLPKEKRDEG
jgi:PAS domain S-box-containing protein